MTTDAPNATANAYLRTKVMSASPEELRLLLLEGGLRFARIGREGLAEKNYEKAFENIIKSKDIVLELINILRPDVDPELCSKLSALYTYVYQRLTDANMTHETAPADEAITLLEYERETWVMLMDQLKAERDAGAPPVETPAQPTARLSVEG